MKMPKIAAITKPARSSKLIVLGATTDGQPVVGNFFSATAYLPLEEVIDRLRKSGYMPHWMDFLDRAKSEGIEWRIAERWLSSAVLDVYGREFHKLWLEGLRKTKEDRSSFELVMPNDPDYLDWKVKRDANP